MIGLLFAWTSFAASVDVKTVRVQATDPIDTSSTRISFTEKRAAGPVRDYGLNTELNEGLARELQYRGLKTTAHARLEVAADAAVTITTGLSRLANQYAEDHESLESEEQTIPIYAASVRIGDDNRGVRADVARDFVYQEWTQPRAAAGLLNGQKYGLAGDAVPLDRLHLHGDAAIVALNDGNLQRTGDAAATFEVWNGRDKVRAGLGLWYDDLRRAGRPYWTPRDFAAVTVRTDSKFNWTRDLALGVLANFGLGGERGRLRDFSYGATLQLDYRVHPDWKLSLGLVRMQAFDPRGTTTWFRNDLSAGLTAAL